MYVIENLHWFVLFIGALVFFHELGHFIAAKACNIKVLRFSVGFGPRLFGVRRGETDYCVSLLPLGGYVKMLGEAPGSDIPPEQMHRAFNNRPVWQRALVLLAGPGFNLALAFVLYVPMIAGEQRVGTTKLGVVTPGEPAWQAGLRAGDTIVEVGGEPVRRWVELRERVAGQVSSPLRVVFERGSDHGAPQRVVTEVTPAPEEETNLFQEKLVRGKIGVSLQYVKPILAVVDEGSPAAEVGLTTGDVITAIDGQLVEAWHEVRAAVGRGAVGKALQITVQREGRQHEVQLVPRAGPPELMRDLFSSANAPGGYTGLVSANTVIDGVDRGTPADHAGLQVGDRLLAAGVQGAVNAGASERDIGVWEIDLAALQAASGQEELVLTYQRGGQVLRSRLRLSEKEEQDELNNVHRVRIFGWRNRTDTLGNYTMAWHVGAGQAMSAAAWQVAQDAVVIGRGVAMLVRRQIPINTVGGPIMLFVIAERTAKQGVQHFLRMLAFISVNLAMLNLMPIPALDGGHLLFCLFEAVWRRPAPARLREVANMFGLVLLLLLMLLVFRNDLMRYVLG